VQALPPDATLATTHARRARKVLSEKLLVYSGRFRRRPAGGNLPPLRAARSCSFRRARAEGIRRIRTGAGRRMRRRPVDAPAAGPRRARDGPRFFRRRGACSLDLKPGSIRLRHPHSRAIRPAKLRGHYHVSRAGAPLRSALLSPGRARVATPGRTPDRAGSQRRLLAVPAARPRLEWRGCAAPPVRLSAPRSRPPARFLRL
jgi:hypothetical protein